MRAAERFAAPRPLLADGAMATTLFAAGLDVNEAPERWLDRYPARVMAVHRAFVAAGADIVLTNSFGANPLRLHRSGLAPRCRALNRLAATLAREAADATSRPVLVAGSIGPLGRALPEAEVAAMVAEQAEGLAAGGVDLAWIETVGSGAELRGAAAGVARAGLPTVVTASFEAGGRTRDGMTPEDFLAIVDALAPTPLAVGLNCGEGPDAALLTLRSLHAATGRWRIVAKPNAGLPRQRDGALVYPATPAAMAEFVRRAVGCGAGLLGGCCGTSPRHLAAMRDALDSLPAGPAPLPTVSPPGHFGGH